VELLPPIRHKSDGPPRWHRLRLEHPVQLTEQGNDLGVLFVLPNFERVQLAGQLAD
jgi:hypothetical protein